MIGFVIWKEKYKQELNNIQIFKWQPGISKSIYIIQTEKLNTKYVQCSQDKSVLGQESSTIKY